MRRPPQKVISALASLQGNPSFETLREWIVEEREDLVQSLTNTKEETLLRWSQGQKQALDHLYDYMTEASKLASR